MHGSLGQAEGPQLLQGAQHDQGDLDLVVVGQFPVADHIYIGLDELPKASLLGALPTPDLLDLPALEGEGQIVAVLHHVAAQRHGQVKMQAQPALHRHILFLPQVLKTGKQVDLLAGLPLLEQAGSLFYGPGLNADVAVQFEDLAERVGDALLHHSL